jgi:hypothetical protein
LSRPGSANVPVDRLIVMAAFGCNFSGEVPINAVISTIEDGLGIADQTGARVRTIGLGESMGWCTPVRVQGVVTAIRERWSDLELSLHLHDRRGSASRPPTRPCGSACRNSMPAVAGLGGFLNGFL